MGDDVMTGLDAIDLKSVGAGLGSGRVLPAHDIVEELYLVPKIPHKKLEDLEKKWRKGEKDTDMIFKDLVELESQELIPSGWMQQGVLKEEDDEEREAEEEEREEEKEEAEKAISDKLDKAKAKADATAADDEE